MRPGLPPAHLSLLLPAEPSLHLTWPQLRRPGGLPVSPLWFSVPLPGLTGTWHCVVQYESEAPTHEHLCGQQHSQNLVHLRNTCGIGQRPVNVMASSREQSSESPHLRSLLTLSSRCGDRTVQNPDIQDYTLCLSHPWVQISVCW